MQISRAISVININAAIANPAAPVTVRKLPSMIYPRAFANGVVLPGGKVLVIGGETHGITFNDDTSVLVPELWDPATEQFTLLAPMQTPRNYHSVALLMPNGKVFSGGGGLCGEGCVANHQDGAIFSPPYLFAPDGVTPAARPVLTAVSSSTVPLGSALSVRTSGPVKSFELIRLSATTHSVNTDQRRVPLMVAAAAANAYTLAVPSDPGIVVPGYWMLFAIDAKGTPSIAKIILIKSPQ